MNLQGKKALVTGGGSGIGLGIAQALTVAGCAVTITGRTGLKLAEASSAEGFGGNAPKIRTCDVSDRAAMIALIDELEPFDIVVNSAGVNIANRRMDVLDPEDFDKLISVNCTGFFNVLHAVLPGMRKRQDGLIFNVSSVAGKRALPIAGPAYAASKFAATALGTGVGTEEAENGIRITNIYPGEVNTPLLNDRPVPVPDEKKAKMVHPEDIGAMVVAISKLPAHVSVPEIVIKPLYQEFL